MAKPLQKIMRYVGQHGIVRPRDIEAIGLPREYLVRLHRQGRLSRPGRGIYTLDTEMDILDVLQHHINRDVPKPQLVDHQYSLCALMIGKIRSTSPTSRSTSNSAALITCSRA